EISARELSKVIVNRSLYNDDNTAHDDITACVIYCRKPRKLLVITGPSVKEENDKQMAETVDKFVGQKIVCGGTTAKIIGRELKKEITVNILEISKKVPPCAHMEGVDLITEGILTLSKVAEYLESGNIPKENNAAEKIIEYLLNNDIINFIVGTKINEAHQDPKMPLDIEIRRSIIKRIIKTLEEKYLKKTILEYI
ncbi:MAG TPA: hypothetical protein PLO89_09170, partial [Spirochaetota bacterium]|nr:hypothetical protein [Spirochaetota bacterium]